ncbi:pseudouridine synthase [Desulfospira joergensenii]|uniref:pseudouridine synthase n=1 Tax=Desulfospira joergensenii TaxID=53329 RepID=UPI0003B6A9D9|nr:pseudouridine synthase [Desulfospira joergensenii]
MRLQKYMAHAGVCSRRKAEAHILDGRVEVNGKIVTTLGTQVDPGKDRVRFDKKPVKPPGRSSHTYILVNKPRGIVTSCAQEKTRIILELVPVKQRVYPVGRLDKDSEGLVLLTDDGELHNRLSHPSHDHEKEYRVTTLYPIKDQALETMAGGMVIDGTRTRKAKVRRLGKNEFRIILKQGLNRQIRKMVGKTGNRVERLLRTRMANLTLGRLKPGQWRHLSREEIRQLTDNSDAHGRSDLVQKGS